MKPQPDFDPVFPERVRYPVRYRWRMVAWVLVVMGIAVGPAMIAALIVGFTDGSLWVVAGCAIAGIEFIVAALVRFRYCFKVYKALDVYDREYAAGHRFAADRQGRTDREVRRDALQTLHERLSSATPVFGSKSEHREACSAVAALRDAYLIDDYDLTEPRNHFSEAIDDLWRSL